MAKVLCNRTTQTGLRNSDIKVWSSEKTRVNLSLFVNGLKAIKNPIRISLLFILRIL